MRLLVIGLLCGLVAISLSSPVSKPSDGSRPIGLLRKIFGLGSGSTRADDIERKTVVPRSRQSRKSHYQGGRRRFRKCRPGLIRNIAGECTEPIVERRVYVYNSPANLARQQQYENFEAQIKPRIDYHLVLINKNEGEVGLGDGLGQNLILNEEEFRNSVQNFGNNFELKTNAELPFNAANHRELLNLINEAQQSQGFQSKGLGFSNGRQAGLSNSGRNLQRYVVVEQSNPRLEDIKQLIREVNRKSQLRALKERQELAARLSQNANANIIDERRKTKKFELDQDNSHAQLLGASHLPLALRTSLGNRLRLGSHFASQAASGFSRGSSGSRSYIKLQSHNQLGGRGRFEESDSTGRDDSESETGSEGGSKGNEGLGQDAESSLGSEGSESSSGSEGLGQKSSSLGNEESSQDSESSSGNEQASESSSGSHKESETEGEQSNAESSGSESEGKQSSSGSKTEGSESVAQSEADNETGSKSNGEQTGGESSSGQTESKSGADDSGSGSNSGVDESGSESSGASQSESESQSDQTKSETMGDDIQTGSEDGKAKMEGDQSATDDGGSKGNNKQTQTEGSDGKQSEAENAQSESENTQSESETTKTDDSQSEIENEQGSSKSEGGTSESSGSENSESSGNEQQSSSSSNSETSESGGSESSSDQETSQSDSLSESENDIESRSEDSGSLNKKSSLYSLSNRRQVIGNESYIKINIASIKDFPQVFVKLNPENENNRTEK